MRLLLLQQHRITLETPSLIPHNTIHLVPPSALDCETNGCRWRTTGTASADIHAYAATIIILLLCAIICALVLHGAVRCFLRNNNNSTTTLPSSTQQLQLHRHPKPAPEAVPVPLAAAPLRVFAPGMKLSGAEAECAICLTEFVAGEEIRVLEICQHGFHVLCIEKWLFSHSSCPTCRSSCIPPKSEKLKLETGTEDPHQDAIGVSPEVSHSVE